MLTSLDFFISFVFPRHFAQKKTPSRQPLDQAMKIQSLPTKPNVFPSRSRRFLFDFGYFQLKERRIWNVYIYRYKRRAIDCGRFAASLLGDLSPARWRGTNPRQIVTSRPCTQAPRRSSLLPSDTKFSPLSTGLYLENENIERFSNSFASARLASRRFETSVLPLALYCPCYLHKNGAIYSPLRHILFPPLLSSL